MNGKLIAGFLVVTALLAGAAVYYLQIYAFYERVGPASATAVIRLTPIAGLPEPMLADGFEGIDADSSPLRFRGCFTTPMTLAMLSETYQPYDAATPLIAPGWFSCFDAKAIGDDIQAGRALAFLSEANIHPGIDRVVAVYADGRAYAWHQPNDTLEK